MKVTLLKQNDPGADRVLLDAMYRQRHQVFAIELGWSALRSADGRDLDEFDDDDAHYLVAHDGQDVCGSLRLLPAWRRSMIRERWPDAVEPRRFRVDPTVWEWTRWCPGVSARPRRLIFARRALLSAAVRFGAARGARRFVTLCETKFVSQLEALGWNPRRLGREVRYPEGVAVAVSWAAPRIEASEGPAHHGATGPADHAALGTLAA